MSDDHHFLETGLQAAEQRRLPTNALAGLLDQLRDATAATDTIWPIDRSRNLTTRRTVKPFWRRETYLDAIGATCHLPADVSSNLLHRLRVGADAYRRIWESHLALAWDRALRHGDDDLRGAAKQYLRVSPRALLGTLLDVVADSVGQLAGNDTPAEQVAAFIGENLKYGHHRHRRDLARKDFADGEITDSTELPFRYRSRYGQDCWREVDERDELETLLPFCRREPRTELRIVLMMLAGWTPGNIGETFGITHRHIKDIIGHLQAQRRSEFRKSRQVKDDDDDDGGGYTHDDLVAAFRMSQAARKAQAAQVMSRAA